MESGMHVRHVFTRWPRLEEPAAAHPEVAHQRAPSIEVEQQVLAVPPCPQEPAPLEPARELARYRLAQLVSRELNRADGAPDHVRLQQSAHGLDLWELGHGTT